MSKLFECVAFAAALLPAGYFFSLINNNEIRNDIILAAIGKQPAGVGYFEGKEYGGGVYSASYEVKEPVTYSHPFAASIFCFLVTAVVIPNASTYFLKRGLKGKDLGKRGTPLEDKEMCGWRTFAITFRLPRDMPRSEAIGTTNM